MKLMLLCASMGKHRAPSNLELFLSRARESIGSQLLPLAVIALTGTGVALAFNAGVQKSLEEKATIADRFIYSCGSVLCQDDDIFTTRPKVVCQDALKDPKIIVDEAIHDNQNTIEIGSLIAPSQSPEDPRLPDTLQKIDRTIAEAQNNNIHVILNLSDLVIRLSVSGKQDPIAQWKNLVESTSKHVNTETGVAYAQDPTIMMIKLHPATQCSDEASASNISLEPQITELTKEAFPRQLVEE